MYYEIKKKSLKDKSVPESVVCKMLTILFMPYSVSL